jgi:hypothetical protein
MNLKIANLVAIQFGIFVGMMAWLTYSHFESAKPLRVAEESRKQPVNSVAPLAPAAPLTDPEDQRPDSEDYRADPDRSQPVTEPPVPVVHYQYSPEAVQQYTALAAQQYYQQIAPRRYASSALENRPAVSTYAKMEPEPAVVQHNEPTPPTIAYDEPAQVVYDEPAQIVTYAQPYPYFAYFNARSFARRCRPARHHGVLASVAPRPHDGRVPHLNGARESCPPRSPGIMQRKEDDAPSGRPNQGFKHHGKR